MSRVTLAQVNEALELQGIKAELIRTTAGGTYHYFYGADVERAMSTGIYTPHTSTYSVAEWVDLARQLKAEHEARAGS